VTELYVAEKYWPTGEPADSERALMTGLIIAASRGDAEAERHARKIWRKLTGEANPARVSKRGMSPDEIKRGMNGLT
jgi:hypothetical protein